MHIIMLVLMAAFFISGLGTLAEAYPNYYRNVAIFTFVYVFFVKVNETFIAYRNKKHPETLLQPSSILKRLIRINDTSTGMHIAIHLSIVSLISSWNLLLLGNGYSALLFAILGVFAPLAIMLAESS